MNKYEQLIEYIINDDEAKAKAIFHDIVVAKSREIYESLMDEEQGGNPVEEFGNEVRADEQGLGEEGDEEVAGDEEFGTNDAEGDFGGEEGGDEFGGEEGGEEGADMSDDEQSERILDLEAALDELKSEFDALMADEENEPEHNDGIEDPEFGGDEMGGEDEMGSEDEMAFEAKSGSGNPFAKSGSGSGSGSGKKGSGSGSGSGSGKKSAVESIREYVEKVSDGHGAEKAGAGEGAVVGKDQSSKPSVNTQTIVAGKNDMGGSTANIARGGSEASPDGTSPKGKAGGFLKSAQEIDVAKRNVNKPGGNKGAQNWYDKKETSWEKNKGAEGKTTDGSLSVSKDSLIGGKIR